MSSTEIVTSLEQSTEEQLVERAQLAVSSCRWVVGECAAQWTTRYARGRTDADFAAQVGLTPDQIFQRRRVWETFHAVQSQYSELKWSHFYAALTWDDSAECLQWAEETRATVAEMKAWRRARRGEDLDQPGEEESMADLMGAGAIQFVPDELSHVTDPGPDYGTGRPGVRIPGQMGEGVPEVLSPAFVSEFRELPTDVQDRFTRAISEFTNRAGDVM